jgi:biopolymer transport protein ExbB
MHQFIFLQSVAVGAADSTSVGQPVPEVTVTVLDLAVKGGWFMIPLVLLLAIAIYIFVERYQVIKKANQDPTAFLGQIREMVRSGDLTRAQAMAEGQNTVTGRMIAKGISRLGMPLADIRTSIENVGNLEVQRLEKRLTMLATISGAAPMVGFLGTVQGLIASFITIASLEGNVNPSVMADGIYTAMVTTAGGLIVGIPAYVGYNVLTSMLNSVIFKLELTSTEFVDLLQEPAR